MSFMYKNDNIKQVTTKIKILALDSPHIDTRQVVMKMKYPTGWYVWPPDLKFILRTSCEERIKPAEILRLRVPLHETQANKFY